MNTPAETSRSSSFVATLVRRALSFLGAVALTAIFFLILPLMQAISEPPDDQMTTASVDVVIPPPPPPPPEEEEDEPEEEEPEPPELAEEPPPLSLAQLELALNQGIGGGWGAADFTVNIDRVVGGRGDSDGGLFDLSELDQKPQVIYQPAPSINDTIRNEAPGTVVLIFFVDTEGRVQNPKILRSDHQVFNRAAINAVKQWRFEPGKRGGEPVRFRMKVPITFPKS